MKRLLLIILLLPSLTFGAFTEFYFDAANGSNLNSGSDAASSAKYTSTNGNWNGSTTFTPTDGTNPVSAGVAAGDFGSIYLDGATVGVCSVRITAVTNANNGPISFSTTAKWGTVPTSGATGRTLKVGGALKGPNGTSHYPFTLGMTSATDASGHPMRSNLKNNSSYAVTTGSTWANGGIIQGYQTTPGDGGRALITTNNGSSTTTITGGGFWSDLEFSCTANSGTSNLLAAQNSSITFRRCIFHGARTAGLQLQNSNFVASYLIECEFYGNNVSNTTSQAAITTNSTQAIVLYYCYIHDNTGSNTAAIDCASISTYNITHTIFDSNGGGGAIRRRSGGSPGCYFFIANNDFYNNGGDAISAATAGDFLVIRNNNFIKNTGAAINISVIDNGLVDNNAYGSGTQANGSANTLNALVDSGTGITYPSNVTQWNAPTTGDFTLVKTNTTAGFNTGLGVFIETDGTNSGTLAYPDVGAAQHNDTCSGTGPCITSQGSAY